MTFTAAEIWRDYETDGDPSSGAHQPVKPEIRTWGTAVESLTSTAFKAPVTCATTGNVALSGLPTIDGHATSAGDRVLVWKNTDPTTNGIYDASSGVWTRSSDVSSDSDWANGTEVFVIFGTQFGNSTFTCTAFDPITLGTTSLTFTGDRGVSGTLTIAPLAGSAAQGLVINQTGPASGTTAGTVTNASLGNPALAYNQIFIASEGASVTGATDPKFTYGFNVAMVTGGTNSTGGKIASNVVLYKSVASAPGTSRDHIALNVTGLIDYGDGGTGVTSSTAKGDMFAAGFVATARGTAANLFEVAGAEVDVGILTGGSAYLRLGWSVVGTGQVQGAGFDAAYEIGAAGQSWQFGHLLANFHGSAPIATTGTVMGTDGSANTVGNIFDFHTYTVGTGGYIFRGPGTRFFVDYAANIGGATLSLGANSVATGTITVYGSTSGTALIAGQAAQGSPTILVPTGSGTLAVSGSSPVVVNAGTGNITFDTSAAEAWTGAHTWTVAQTIASATAAHWRNLYMAPATTTITGNTGSPITRMDAFSLGQQTLTDSSAVTVTDAATLYIDNAPAAAGSVTITNAWAFLVGAGNVKLSGTANAVGTITSGVWNAGAVTSSGAIITTATTDATTISTGALQTAGGLGVTKTSYFGGVAHFTLTSLNAATGAGFWLDSVTTGADRWFFGADAASADVFRIFSVLAGVNIFQYTASATPASGAGTFQGSLVATASLSAQGTTASTSTTTGSIVGAGGMGIAKKIFAGDNIDVASGKVYTVAGTQVVAGRITGYTAMTGSPDKATAYATGSVTLAQLAGRVAQLQADLTTHGLIGA